MATEAPPFWWQKADWRAVTLWPASLVWGRIAAQRMARQKRIEFELPVISVSTMAIGATGRTLLAMALAEAAIDAGRRPGILTAGPRGTSGAPHRVDSHHDLARHVGDEALELASVAPTVVAADAAAGARALAADGCDLVLLADGRVSDRLAADRIVIVVEASRGLGNGFVAPAGPVRAPITSQLRQAHALVRLGSGDTADRLVRLASRAGRPVIDARISLDGAAAVVGRRLLAFAGLGDNAPFFAALKRAGAEVVQTRNFVDGHAYAQDELQDLIAAADAQQLELVTTRRDLLRLRQGGEAALAVARRALTVTPQLGFDPADGLQALVRGAIDAHRSRR